MSASDTPDAPPLSAAIFLIQPTARARPHPGLALGLGGGVRLWGSASWPPSQVKAGVDVGVDVGVSAGVGGRRGGSSPRSRSDGRLFQRRASSHACAGASGAGPFHQLTSPWTSLQPDPAVTVHLKCVCVCVGVLSAPPGQRVGGADGRQRGHLQVPAGLLRQLGHVTRQPGGVRRLLAGVAQD